jgi:CDP-diacylglycerol--serine O-phosphatidyltransferase
MINSNLSRKEKAVASFPLIRLLPNIVTLICLCVGLSAIRFSINGEWVKATSFLLFAGFLDGIDGRLARFLNSSSAFGAELDSLADFVNFGVVPGIVIYLWINQSYNIKGFDWAMVLFFTVCMAIRLARFNVALSKEVKNPILEKYFFIGIPAPVGAALAMLPMVLSYEFGNDYFFTNPIVVMCYIFILAAFGPSKIPTISIKKIPIRNEYVYLTLMILALIIIGLITTPWLTLALIGIIYAFSIPVTVFFYFRIKNRSQL